MAYAMHSITAVDHPAQHKVDRAAIRALKKSKLTKRLDELADELTPYVARELNLREEAARKQAQRWILRTVAELVAMPIGDVVFFE